MSTNLKDLRQAAKMTQSEVAKALNVDQSAVSRWEKGAHPLKKYRGKLARLYHVKENDLFSNGKVERTETGQR